MTKNIRNRVWEKEKDAYGFQDEESGYKCYIYRHTGLGHLCGYVVIPQDHVLFGVDYLSKIFQEITNDEIEVHGGVTYTGRIKSNYKIKEMPECFNVNDWLIGFDCNHFMDYSPFGFNGERTIIEDDHEYRDVEYVTLECRKLAKQLKDIENKQLVVTAYNEDDCEDECECMEEELYCNDCGEPYHVRDMIELDDNKLVYQCQCGYENLFI
jgi:uncharacterized protein YbaR (Trm112 family)